MSQNRHKMLEKHGLAVPQPVVVFAQIDTGSSVSGFMPNVFQSLQIGPISRIRVRTPSTRPGQPYECDQFDVSITLASGTTTKYLPSVHAIVSEDFDAREEGFSAILGRDVLSSCSFSYFGLERKFQLAF